MEHGLKWFLYSHKWVGGHSSQGINRLVPPNLATMSHIIWSAVFVSHYASWNVAKGHIMQHTHA